MAFKIQIKSSTTTAIVPDSSVTQAELAYSFVTGDSDGGDRLYIGNASGGVDTIGGKYYTDMMDHTKGAVKASSAIITDANNKIDQLNVDTLSLDSSTISTTGFHLFLNTNSTFVKLDSVQIKDVADPTLAQDAATKAYVDASILTKDNTDEIAEGTNNLYYTTTRADSDFDVRLGTKSTSDLAEGSNLYYTTTRADSDFDTRLGTKTTSDVAEGSNLFHTTARARAAVSVTDAGGDGSLSYDSSTGVFTYTGPNAAEVRAHLTANKGLSVSNGEFNIDSANVRGMFSAAGDLSYNSGTGQFSFDVEDVYTKANFDSDLGTASTTDLPEGSNLYYTDARVTSHVDKAFVDNLGTNADTLDGYQAQFFIDKIDSNTASMLDSVEAIALIDSAYVRARVKTDQDLLSTSTVTFGQIRGPENFIIDPAAIGDNTGTVQILGNLQVEGTQTTINSTTVSINDKNIILADSAANAAAADGAGITINGAAATLTYAASGDKFVFNKPIEGNILGFDSDFNAKSTDDLTEGSTNKYFNGKTTTDLPEGTNLYYTKLRADSDIAASLNDSGNTVNITITNTIIDQVDSDYVLARVAEAPFLDSADATQLIDSAYVQLRQTDQDFAYGSLTGAPTIPTLGTDFVDSGQVTAIVDASYIQTNQTSYNTSNFTDSAFVTGLPVSTFTNDADYLDSTSVQGVIDQTYVRNNQIVYNTSDFLDSSTVSLVVDNAYVQARQTKYDTSDFVDSAYLEANSIDSARTIALIDSAYIRLHTRIGDSDIDFGSNKILYSNVYSVEGDLPSASTYHGMFAHVHGTGAAYFAHAGSWTKLANYSDINPYSDADVTSLVDSAYIILRDRFQDSAGIAIIVDSAYIAARTTAGTDSAAIIQLIDSAYVQARQTAGGGGGVDSAAITQLIDSDYVASRASSAAPFTQTLFEFTADSGQVAFTGSDDNSNVLSFSNDKINVYLNGLLLSPVQDYSVSGGNTVTLSSAADSGGELFVVTFSGNSLGVDSAEIIQLIDSAYVAARTTAGTDSAAIIQLIDSAYVAARTTAGTDSAAIIQLIDSDYIRNRAILGAGEYNQARSEFTATSGQTLFDTLSDTDLQTNNTDVFINGILQIQTTDYTIDSSAVTLTVAANTADTVSIVERKGTVLTQRGLQLADYHFATSTPTTTFTGTDDNGATLDISVGFYDVFLNGILLKDSDDYSVDGDGTTVTLTSATDSSDLLTIRNSKGIVVTPNINSFEYVADSGQVTFTGADAKSKNLTYVPNSVAVYLNGLLLKPVTDYVATTGQDIVLTSAADINDELTLQAFAAPGTLLTTYKYTADSGQTIFRGKDLADLSLHYEPGNIQVFLNGLLLNDSDDYIANNSNQVVLNSGATINDELKISAFNTISSVDRDTLTYRTWSAPTGTVSASAGDKLFIDTSGGARTVNLPSTALQGDEIRIIDVTGNAATNNITVGRNGHIIQGAASDLTININRTALGLVYYDVTQGWLLIEN